MRRTWGAVIWSQARVSFAATSRPCMDLPTAYCWPSAGRWWARGWAPCPRLVVWLSGTGSPAPESWHRVEGAGWKSVLGRLEKQELCRMPHKGVRQWDFVCGGWF